MSKVLNSFLHAFDRIDHVLDSEVVEGGKNGTGYLDGLVKLEKPTDETVSKFTDSLNRRGIVYYTDAGNVVVFERYSQGSGSPVVFVSNGPQWWNLISQGAIDIDTMDTLSNNINYPNNIVKSIVKELNK